MVENQVFGRAAVGAWIEISIGFAIYSARSSSLPPWERGLKLAKTAKPYTSERSRSPRQTVRKLS